MESGEERFAGPLMLLPAHENAVTWSPIDVPFNRPLPNTSITSPLKQFTTTGLIYDSHFRFSQPLMLAIVDVNGMPFIQLLVSK